jgi:hypothetical protein
MPQPTGPHEGAAAPEPPEPPPLSPNNESALSVRVLPQRGQTISMAPELERTSFSNFSPHS